MAVRRRCLDSRRGASPRTLPELRLGRRPARARERPRRSARGRSLADWPRASWPARAAAVDRRASRSPAPAGLRVFRRRLAAVRARRCPDVSDLAALDLDGCRSVTPIERLAALVSMRYGPSGRPTAHSPVARRACFLSPPGPLIRPATTRLFQPFDASPRTPGGLLRPRPWPRRRVHRRRPRRHRHRLRAGGRRPRDRRQLPPGVSTRREFPPLRRGKRRH